MDRSKLSEDEQLRIAIEESLKETTGQPRTPSAIPGDTGSGASSIYGGFAFGSAPVSSDKRARSRQRGDGSASPARGLATTLGPPPPPRAPRSALSTRPHSPVPDDVKGTSEHIEHHDQPADQPAIVVGDKNPFRNAMPGASAAGPPAVDTAAEAKAVGSPAAPADDELPSYTAVPPPLPQRPIYVPDDDEMDIDKAVALSMEGYSGLDRDGDTAMAGASSPAKAAPVEDEKGSRSDAGFIPEDVPRRAKDAYVSPPGRLDPC